MKKTDKGTRTLKSTNSLKLTVIFLDILLLFILSYLVPKHKRILVFGGINSKFIGNPKYLFEYINNNYEKYTCFFYSDDEEVINYLKSKNVNVLHKNSLKAKYYLLRANYIFVNGGWADVSRDHFIGRFRVINLWHGDPIKKIGFSVKDGPFFQKGIFAKSLRYFFAKQYKKTYFFITKGEFFKPFLKEGFLTNKVKVTGYPVNDVFFDKNKRKLINKKFKIFKKYKKIFLYAPTYRDDYFEPFSKDFSKKLNTYFKKKDFLFLIKTHPSSNTLNISESNILDISKKDFDFQEIMMISDVLISDYSGAVSDFMVQEKPVLIYNFDEKSYKQNSRDLYFTLSKNLPKDLVCKYEDVLFEKIKNIDEIVSTKKYKKEYEYINNKFNKYKDGDSCKRICEELTL